MSGLLSNRSASLRPIIVTPSSRKFLVADLVMSMPSRPKSLLACLRIDTCQPDRGTLDAHELRRLSGSPCSAFDVALAEPRESKSDALVQACMDDAQTASDQKQIDALDRHAQFRRDEARAAGGRTLDALVAVSECGPAIKASMRSVRVAIAVHRGCRVRRALTGRLP